MLWEENWHLESPLQSKPHGGFGGEGQICRPTMGLFFCNILQYVAKTGDIAKNKNARESPFSTISRAFLGWS